MKKEKTKRGLGFKTAVLLTACAIIFCSVLPLATLLNNDKKLLQGSYERTRKAGKLSLSADDIYLTRILKQYANRYSMDGYINAQHTTSTMTQTDTQIIRSRLDELHNANMLTDLWYETAIADLDDATYESHDSLGFSNYINVMGIPERDEFIRAAITTEKQTDKVTGFFLAVPVKVYGQISDADTQRTDMDIVNNTITYLGLDILPDWEPLYGVSMENSAMYSEKGELLVCCSRGEYEAYRYPHYPDYQETNLRMNYFCVNAISMPPDTVAYWKEYESSFTEQFVPQPEMPPMDIETESKERAEWEGAE